MTVKSVKPCSAVFTYVLFYLFFDTILSKILLVNSGFIETNLSPRKYSSIKFFHWNLNGLAAPDFIKLALIETFISTHDFDICLRLFQIQQQMEITMEIDTSTTIPFL